MRAHYLQHIPFEGLGSIASWLEASGYEITGTKFFESVKYPNLKEIDLLVILGGPMSVNDKDKFSCLASEKQFIHESINSGKPVLGICLGAQLIASALGARVYRNSVKEIGWFPIYGISSNNKSIFSFPPSVKVFHWHGETFDLPSGATRLAKSDVCENQAFQFGNSIIGVHTNGGRNLVS
jgi:GMP synthase-like glutamine amidotransferase